MRKAEEAAAWRKAEAPLTDYDYYLRSMTYYMRYTRDDNRRSRKISDDGLARFPDSALLKIGAGMDLRCGEQRFRTVGELPGDKRYRLQAGARGRGSEEQVPVSDLTEPQADGPRLRLRRRA